MKLRVFGYSELAIARVRRKELAVNLAYRALPWDVPLRLGVLPGGGIVQGHPHKNRGFPKSH